MKKYLTVKTLGIALAVVVVAGIVAWDGKANESAQSNQLVAAQATDKKSTEQPAKKQEAQAVTDYKYTAQPGDTYSQFARKAVQSYGIVNKINLTQGQIIFAETTLVQTAGSPLLDLGEQRTIQQVLVKDVVEKANKLTDAQKAAWAAYAVGVDFNTNNIGQKR